MSDGDELARQRRDGVRNEARKLGQERPDPAVIPQRKGDLPEHPASQPACEDEIVERSADTRHIWFPNRPDYEHLGPDALEVLDDFAWTIYGLRAGRT